MRSFGARGNHLGCGLAECHGQACLQGLQRCPLAGLDTAAWIIPLTEQLTGFCGSPTGFCEAARAEPTLLALAVDDNA